MKSKYSKMFMDIVAITAQQSTCVKYQVGAVIVKDNRVIIQGYNGTPSGAVNCKDIFAHEVMHINEAREAHTRWSASNEIHAEMNCICYAARKGISLEGTTMYCSYHPCNNCLKHLIQVGVKEVIYLKNIPEKHEKDREGLLNQIIISQYNES